MNKSAAKKLGKKKINRLNREGLKDLPPEAFQPAATGTLQGYAQGGYSVRELRPVQPTSLGYRPPTFPVQEIPTQTLQAPIPRYPVQGVPNIDVRGVSPFRAAAEHINIGEPPLPRYPVSNLPMEHINIGGPSLARNIAYRAPGALQAAGRAMAPIVRGALGPAGALAQGLIHSPDVNAGEPNVIPGQTPTAPGFSWGQGYALGGLISDQDNPIARSMLDSTAAMNASNPEEPGPRSSPPTIRQDTQRYIDQMVNFGKQIATGINPPQPARASTSVPQITPSVSTPGTNLNTAAVTTPAQFKPMSSPATPHGFGDYYGARGTFTRGALPYGYAQGGTVDEPGTETFHPKKFGNTYGVPGTVTRGALPGTQGKLNANTAAGIAGVNRSRSAQGNWESDQSPMLTTNPGAGTRSRGVDGYAQGGEVLSPEEIDRRRYAAWNNLKGGLSGLSDKAYQTGLGLGQSVLDANLFQPGPNKLNIDFSPPGSQYDPAHEIRNFNANVATTPGVTPSAFGGERYVPEQAATATLPKAEKTEVIPGPGQPALPKPALTPPPSQPAAKPPVNTEPMGMGVDLNTAHLGNRNIYPQGMFPVEQSGALAPDTRLNETLTQQPGERFEYGFQTPGGGQGTVSSTDQAGMRRVAGLEPSKGSFSVIPSTTDQDIKQIAHQAGMAAMRAGGNYDETVNQVLTGKRPQVLPENELMAKALGLMNQRGTPGDRYKRQEGLGLAEVARRLAENRMTADTAKEGRQAGALADYNKMLFEAKQKQLDPEYQLKGLRLQAAQPGAAGEQARQALSGLYNVEHPEEFVYPQETTPEGAVVSVPRSKTNPYFGQAAPTMANAALPPILASYDVNKAHWDQLAKEWGVKDGKSAYDYALSQYQAKQGAPHG